MCGITGIYQNSKLKTQNLKPDIQKMTDTMAHRGPDDEGVFIDHNFALGHRRLSIIDLTAAGHQPMSYDHNNLVIVHNGEVYNYLEIREELIKKGYKFKSQTDTEVILASYQEWGTECLKKFNGMWAFVIFDKRKKLLFGARDRAGIKPLYYHNDKNKFLFASEIKAILAYPEVQAKPNERIIWDYLISGLVDHSENTFFEGIKELRGGHYFILKDEKFKITQYWDLDVKKISVFAKDNEYSDEFQKLFLDSILLRLRSDVPIGTCLSGGLDSSAIVCAVNEFLKKAKNLKQIGKWQQTFSACYDTKKYQGCDERKFIDIVIKKTKARSNCVFPSGKKLSEEIKKLIWHQDMPFASTSIYAQWNVFRKASQNQIKVMLDGQGSDELLAGYHSYFAVYFGELLRKGKILQFISEARYYSKIHHRSVFFIFKEFFGILIRRGFLGKGLNRLFGGKWQEYEVFEESFREKFKSPALLMPTNNAFKNSLYHIFKVYLCSLLRYEDRNSMAFSIESRVPFLDYRLIEFAFSLPDNQKIHHGQTKWVMRQAFKGLLPEKIRTRQDKIGFATPEEIWLRGVMKKEMAQVFASKSFICRSYWLPGKVQKMYKKFLTGEIKNFALFWRLYCLEIWFRRFID